MIGFRCDVALINLESESGAQLGNDLLERRYTIETFCYFVFEMDYKPFPQATTEDCAWMARAILLHLLRAYFFANGE